MHNDSVPLCPTPTLPLKEYSITAAPTTSVQIPGPNAQVSKVLLGPENTVTTCQFCHASIKTAVKYTTTTRTHIVGLLYCLICCCLCCIGYCSNSTKNSDHYCPNCQRYLGTYEK